MMTRPIYFAKFTLLLLALSSIVAGTRSAHAELTVGSKAPSLDI